MAAAVKEAIRLAVEKTGWSMAKLAERTGVHANTLTRWSEGNVRSFSLEGVVEIFKYAEISMDNAFGVSLASRGAADPGLMRIESMVEETRSNVNRLLAWAGQESEPVPAQRSPRKEAKPLAGDQRDRALDAGDTLAQSLKSAAVRPGKAAKTGDDKAG